MIIILLFVGLVSIIGGVLLLPEEKTWIQSDEFDPLTSTIMKILTQRSKDVASLELASLE